MSGIFLFIDLVIRTDFFAIPASSNSTPKTYVKVDVIGL